MEKTDVENLQEQFAVKIKRPSVTITADHGITVKVEIAFLSLGPQDCSFANQVP